MTIVGILGAIRGRGYPKFRNDLGAVEIRIGVKEFECIGQLPPQDHPHIYLEMGVRDEMLCPYCSTLYRFDQSLRASEAIPAESLFSGQ